MGEYYCVLRSNGQLALQEAVLDQEFADVLVVEFIEVAKPDLDWGGCLELVLQSQSEKHSCHHVEPKSLNLQQTIFILEQLKIWVSRVGCLVTATIAHRRKSDHRC